MKISCRLCSNKRLVKVINLGKLPIVHRLLVNPGEKECLFPFSLKILSRITAKKVSKLYFTGLVAGVCTVINGLRLGKYVDFAVDEQTQRLNKYMPRSRLPIYASKELSKVSYLVMCLMAVNNENEAKVKKNLEKMPFLKARFVSLFSSNDIWKELSKI